MYWKIKYTGKSSWLINRTTLAKENRHRSKPVLPIRALVDICQQSHQRQLKFETLIQLY